MNGDGRLDLFVGSGGSNQAYLLLRNDHGGFESHILPGAATRCVGIAHVDADGQADLLLGRGPGREVWVYWNSGDASPTFTTIQPVVVGSDRFVIADIDHDGLLDLAGVRPSSASVVRNLSKRQFAMLDEFPVATDAYDLDVGDLNGDPELDIAVANRSSDTVSVFINGGNADFSGGTAYTVGDTPLAVTIADLTGDGPSEIVTANEEGDSVTVLENDGTGLFPTSHEFPAGVNPNALLAADLDHDSCMDLAVCNGYSNGSSGSLVILRNAGCSQLPTCPGDLNDDGMVNGADLSVLLAAFGSSCGF